MAKSETLREALGKAYDEAMSDMFEYDYGQFRGCLYYREAFEQVLTYLRDIEVFMPNPDRNHEISALVQGLRDGRGNVEMKTRQRIQKCIDMAGKDDRT